MREYREKRFPVGFKKSPKIIFDEIELFTARMTRDGWILEESVADDTLEYIDLIFYREIDTDTL